MSHDASVSSLMQTLQDAERRRRVVTMRNQEVEAHITLDTEVGKGLEKLEEEMMQKERTLQQELNSLSEDLRQHQLQRLGLTNRLRQCEVEEPVLHSLAVQQLEKVEETIRSWRTKHQQLECLKQSWDGDLVAVSLRAQREELSASTQELKARLGHVERELLQQDIELARLHEAQALLAKSGLSASENDGGCVLQACGPNHSSATTTEEVNAAIQSIKEVLQQRQFEHEQCRLQQERQRGALHRELEDLHQRVAELKQWQDAAETAEQQLREKQSHLQQCLAEGVCMVCLESTT